MPKAAKKKPRKKDVKKTAKKKAAAKKVVGKKATDKKATDKKATDKKATNKKTVSKKTVNKKTVSKKSAAKKAVGKQVVAQKKAGKPAAIKGSPKVLVSPSYTGAPKKLARDTYPEKATAKAFRCFGPPATHDGQLEEVRICDLGCFTQDGKDSNKYYHGAVVQHRKSNNWYTYFEWGRTGGASCSFQFVACKSEEEARAVFSKKLHTKNDKRGEWVTVAGIKTLRAKKGKDCYLVRPMAMRTTGLPDARRIKLARETKKPRVTSTAAPKGDPKTLKLMKDLQRAVIAYTRKSMADSSVPTQTAINEARQILGEAQSHVATIDEDIAAQVKDKRLLRLTELMFSRIPRKKKVRSPPATWMLLGNNIQDWQDDLDAFESALHAVDLEMNPNPDILGDMKLDMEWVDPKSTVGDFLLDWCPQATVKQHKKIDDMSIANIWEVNQHIAKGVIEKSQSRVLKSKVNTKIRPLHQPKTRIDIASKQRGVFKRSNTALLFHGTRSVNVNAILRESLRMPETLVAVALTGAKFGPGIYFSDDWKKAADYTNVQGSSEAGRKGAVRGRQAFMFVADVVLGTPHIAPNIHGYTKPPRGHHSVFGKAGHSGVVDNEFVVYKKDQCKLRYLVEFQAS